MADKSTVRKSEADLLEQQPADGGQGAGAPAENRPDGGATIGSGSTDELFNVATAVAPSDPEAEAFADLEAELEAAAKEKVLKKKDGRGATGTSATDDLLSVATAMTSEGGVESELEGEITAAVAGHEKRVGKKPGQAAAEDGGHDVQDGAAAEPIVGEVSLGDEPLRAGGPAPDGPDDDDPAPGLHETIEDLNQEIASLRKKAEEYREAALQVRAEAEAEKQRMQRDVEKSQLFALEKSIQELLPIMDSVEFGLQAADASDSDSDVTALREGMALTLGLFAKFMESSGVEVINPAGKKFDPEMHEAVSAQPVPGFGHDQVVTVVQKGYVLNGRLLRPAKVIVSG